MQAQTQGDGGKEGAGRREYRPRRRRMSRQQPEQSKAPARALPAWVLGSNPAPEKRQTRSRRPAPGSRAAPPLPPAKTTPEPFPGHAHARVRPPPLVSSRGPSGCRGALGVGEREDRLGFNPDAGVGGQAAPLSAPAPASSESDPNNDSGQLWKLFTPVSQLSLTTCL